ncbi:MAG: CDP-diacylglycerol--serine O-phosphatidyltransferase [Verrucomicrobia bacterium]|nr:MAG: CDP-diacylglycerol--serine O-phosphatidyltransferase [Verrucomicrobiota bacterium]
MKRGIYLFPALLTLSNLAAGVMSMLFAARYHLSSAAWCIIAGIILDMLDGRVARWANATSQFGVELDSLCDLVTFGVAPAFLMYRVALEPLGRPGYMIVIFFVMTAVLRLARFKSTHFVGLPVPAAAGILASFVLSYELFGNDTISAKTIPLVMKRMPFFYRFVPLVMILLAFLMVSNVQYGNFKQLKLGRPKSVQNLAFLLVGLLLIFTYPQNMIFVVFSLYVLAGLVSLAWRFYHAQRAKRTAGRPVPLYGRRKTDVGQVEESMMDPR